MESKNNIPAFACVVDNSYLQTGMSLLDYFAGQAIVGILPTQGVGVPQKIAQDAYKITEAMLKEREKYV
jgi:hypothetical protein